MALDTTITYEEFEKRLAASNERMRQEIADAEERIRLLDALIERKEAYAKKLDKILAEIEQEEAEIAAEEKKLRPLRVRSQRRRRSQHTASA